MSQAAAQEFFRKGIAFAQAGDLASAEANLKQCIAADPKNALAMLNLGIVLMNRGSFPEAEAMLSRSVNIQGTVDNISALARAFELNGKLDKAEDCYRAILKATPNHVPSLVKLAEIANRYSDHKTAREFFKKAWDLDQKNIEAGIGYALAVFEDDPSKSVSAMDSLLAVTKDDSAIQAEIYLRLLPYREFYERMKRGLMPYHATSLDELFFKFTPQEHSHFTKLSLKEPDKNPRDIPADTRKFYALFSSGKRIDAEKQLQNLISAFPEHIYENFIFDPAFYEKLDSQADTELTKKLPPLIEYAKAEFRNGPVAYLACNYDYFAEFAAPMIRSLAEKNPEAQLHLHIMDAEDSELKQLASFCREIAPLRIAASVEHPAVNKKNNKTARAYYHAVRFIRFYNHLRQYRRPLWLMDVDALFNRDPNALYSMLGNSDVALRARPGRLEPWNQLNACIVGATSTEASLRYFRLVAGYIAHFFQQDKLRWGIDQLAMYGVFEFLRDQDAAPSLSLLNDQAIDYSYRDDGIVWCNSGKKKFSLDDAQDDDPARQKYNRRFRKYYKPM